MDALVYDKRTDATTGYLKGNWSDWETWSPKEAGAFFSFQGLVRLSPACMPRSLAFSRCVRAWWQLLLPRCACVFARQLVLV